MYDESVASLLSAFSVGVILSSFASMYIYYMCNSFKHAENIMLSIIMIMIILNLIQALYFSYFIN